MEDLDELDAIFNDIGGNEGAEEAAKGSFKEIEDGDYEAEIIAVEYTHSKKSGNPMVKIEYGLEDSRHHWQYLTLVGKDEDGSKRNVGRFVTVMKQLGLNEDSISSYVKKFETLEGKRVRIKIETKNDFTNTHILG